MFFDSWKTWMKKKFYKSHICIWEWKLKKKRDISSFLPFFFLRFLASICYYFDNARRKYICWLIKKHRFVEDRKLCSPFLICFVNIFSIYFHKWNLSQILEIVIMTILKLKTEVISCKNQSFYLTNLQCIFLSLFQGKLFQYRLPPKFVQQRNICLDDIAFHFTSDLFHSCKMPLWSLNEFLCRYDTKFNLFLFFISRSVYDWSDVLGDSA